ncbi:MAG TPA: hypothetical protein VGU45_11875 [Microvirga sp.]|jgi:hypothetical protein|nr:hypothetical protein [Microvirga sp.]
MTPLPADRFRYFSAYGEAACVATAYVHGWYLNPRGVRLDGDCGSYFRLRMIDNTEQAHVCMLLAFRIGAERAGCAINDLLTDESLAECIEDVRSGSDQYDDSATKAVRRIMCERPFASDQQIIEVFRFYQTATQRIVGSPGMWAWVESITAALLKKGQLCDREVTALKPLLLLMPLSVELS